MIQLAPLFQIFNNRQTGNIVFGLRYDFALSFVHILLKENTYGQFSPNLHKL